MNDGLRLVSDTFSVSLIEAERTLPKAEKAALRKIASEARKLTKRNLLSKVPNARKPNEKYVDTLYDAPRATKIKDGSVVVHVMGTRSSGSGTFRARFFEGGTKDRYATTRNGVQLKKKAYRGKIEAQNYFGSALQEINPQALKIMGDTIQKYLEKVW